jgi:hypothetical protein
MFTGTRRSFQRLYPILVKYCDKLNIVRTILIEFCGFSSVFFANSTKLGNAVFVSSFSVGLSFSMASSCWSLCLLLGENQFMQNGRDALFYPQPNK